MSEKHDAFGWNDKVEVPESGFELLPKGPAVFRIIELKRERKEYGKFGVCNVAVMTFLCSPLEGEGTAEVQSQFALVKALGWKIVKLATACGFRKHGDSNEIDPRWWAMFDGATGRCEIGHRPYNRKKDGKEVTTNEITDFLPQESGDRSQESEGEAGGEFDNIPF
jgi:hypothetical protein